MPEWKGPSRQIENRPLSQSQEVTTKENSHKLQGPLVARHRPISDVLCHNEEAPLVPCCSVLVP